MPYSGLSEFLEELLSAGEIVRVAAPVNLDLEIAEITARVAAADGPALLFERGVFAAGARAEAGSPASGQEGGAGRGLPVVANLLGSEARACRALGVGSFAALAERMANLARPAGGASWLDRLRGAGDTPPQERFRPKLARQAACQQVVRVGRDVDLAALPAARSWPQETARGLSGRLLMPWPEAASAPSSDAVRLSIARGIVAGRRQLAFSPVETPGSGRRGLSGAPQPAAFILGGDPAGWLAAAIDWAPVDGYTLAGMLRNQAWDVATARSQPLAVPADAEFVIEGLCGPAATFDELDPAVSSAIAELRLADPATGYYRDPQRQPWLLAVTAITHRANPIAPLWIAGDLRGGRPTGETAVLQAFRRCLLAPSLMAAIPELADVALPLTGAATGMVALAIRKTAPGQARRAASALWGVAALEATKWVVVVDADIDPHDTDAVLARLAANVAPERDIFFHSSAGDGVDHAAPAERIVERVGIDATAKLPGEHPRDWPAVLARPHETVSTVTCRWSEYGLKEG